MEIYDNGLAFGRRTVSLLDVFRALAALSVCAVHFNFDSFFHNHFANGLTQRWVFILGVRLTLYIFNY